MKKSKIKTIDKSNMRQVLKNFPFQFEKALKFSKGIKVKGKFDNVIVCGMGGSAWPGELVDTYLSDLKIPLFVCRDYTLPKEATKKSLIFSSSYSGDTEEPISTYGEARKRKLTIVGFSKGGLLEKLCRRDKVPFVKYPDDGSGFQPRYATGYIFVSLVKVLSNSGLVSDKSKEIIKTAQFLKNLNLENRGRNLAQELKGKIPLIYSSDQLKSIPYIWKIKFNETSKVMAFNNYFPEMNHNDMTGFTLSKRQGRFYAIFLRDREDHLRIKARMQITSKLLKSKGTKVIFIDSLGNDRLSRIFSLINFGDWVTYYLALENGIDPTPTKLQVEFKKRLAKI
jgi:glucose/mannose-6-phosphate isomerase